MHFRHDESRIPITVCNDHALIHGNGVTFARDIGYTWWFFTELYRIKTNIVHFNLNYFTYLYE